MKSLRSLALLACLIVLSGAEAAGEELPLTVQQAVARALAVDPAVAAAAAVQSAAEAAQASRRLDRLPSLQVVAGYSRLNEVDPSPITGTASPANSYGMGAELRQPLLSGGRLTEQARAAALEAQAAGSDARAARLQLRLQVVRTYWQLQRHTASVAALRERHGQVRELDRELQSRFEQGLATREELLRVQSLAADAQLRLARSETARQLAASELAILTGLPRGMSVVAVSALPEDLPPLPEADALWLRAEQVHPQLLAAGLRVEITRSAERIARAGLFPSLALSGSYGYQSPDTRVFPPEEELAPYWRLGASISFDLLSPLRVPAAIREAASRRMAAQDGAGALRDRLFLALMRAHAEARLAGQEVQAAEAARAYAAESRRAVQERYDRGAALRSVLLDAQAALLEADLRLIDARVGEVVSRAALAAAAGTAASTERAADGWAAVTGFIGGQP